MYINYIILIYQRATHIPLPAPTPTYKKMNPSSIAHDLFDSIEKEKYPSKETASRLHMCDSYGKISNDMYLAYYDAIKSNKITTDDIESALLDVCPDEALNILLEKHRIKVYYG